MGGLGGLGGEPTGFVFGVGIAPACWDTCRGGGRMLDLRGGRGGTGVDPAIDRDGEGIGTGMAGFVLEMLFARFMNGFGLLVGELDARVVVSGIEPSSLEKVDPLRVGLALFGAEVARLAKGLFEWKAGVEGGSLAADETEMRSVWTVLGVVGADRFGGSGGGGERRRVSCAGNRIKKTRKVITK